MNISTALATLFGIGRAPGAPGTVASVVALILAGAIAFLGGRYVLLAATAVAIAVGVWASGEYIKTTRERDPSECVIDELAGQWLACAIAPRTVLAYLAVFALFRMFDILKPWPISRFEAFGGGWGIMADDLGAAVLAGFVVYAISLVVVL